MLLFSITIAINPFCYLEEEAGVLDDIQNSLCILISSGLLPTFAYLHPLKFPLLKLSGVKKEETKPFIRTTNATIE